MSPKKKAHTSLHYVHLKKKWAKKHREVQKQLWKKHGHHLVALQNKPKQALVGSVAGLIMLAQPVPATLMAQTIPTEPQHVEETSAQKQTRMISELEQVLPQSVDPLTPEQETQVSEILGKHFNVSVAASLEGKRLNRSYGLIGAEQHLMRYPGDTMATHFNSPEESERFYSSGMAPGRGAWGYFAYSREGMTATDIQREKYYIAVPTFLSPTWHDNVGEHYKFFKYRKMLVVNPENGKGIVADIGDSGPAPSTGKHLGGSPEVMNYLERVDGRAKGPVIYLFIDDPHNDIPLGPIDIAS